MKWLFGLLLLTIAPATPAYAQQAALDSMKSGRRYVRLQFDDGGAAVGRIERLNADSVWLRYDRYPVILSSIEQIEARQYTMDPLINGTLLGAGIGAVAGLLLSTVCIGCEYYTGEEQTIVVGSALFGALVGFTVDLAREEWHWRLLWRRAE